MRVFVDFFVYDEIFLYECKFFDIVISFFFDSCFLFCIVGICYFWKIMVVVFYIVF